MQDLTPEQKVKLVRHYIWTEAHRDPDTMVRLHTVISELTDILDGKGKIPITPEIEEWYWS